MPASAVKFTSACLWLFALLECGWTQDVVNNSRVNGERVPTTGSTFPTKTGYVRHPRASTSEAASVCLTPPQPANGEYKLDRYFCDDIVDCKVSVGAPLEPGSTLVYRCNPGYKVEGKSDVNCRGRGKWSPIPECVEVKCDPLTSVSTTVSCTHFGKDINCHSPVPPGTRAEVTCRRGYKKDTEFVTDRRGVVNCNVKGKWDPQPIRCIPVCGRTITNQRPFVFGGSPAKIGEFPWHASLFQQMDSPAGNLKVFSCGATIIHNKLLLTAAHCVYDEVTRTTLDPGKLLVITGNIFRDYDSPAHNPNVVRKATVKNVYTFCNYYGLEGNYVSDIALLELHQPFEFSEILLPACLDDSEYSEQFLEPGVFGRVAGFGRTETGTTSGILQTITVPYIAYSKCRASNHASQNLAFISSDKFCAGYNNGSAVCEGDSGGGLVFRKGELWYVMGIVSVGLGVDTSTGESTCDKYTYTLYTKVSVHMTWLQNVLSSVDRNERYPSCSQDSQTTTANPMTTTTAPSSITSSLPYSCSAPPQPANGERKLHRTYCEDHSGTDCDISPGTKVKSGSQLVYRCASGFTIKGTTDVYCLGSGEWTPLPACIGADSCDLKNGSLGACTLLRDCQPLLDELKAGKPPKQHCGFSEAEPIVCCPITTTVVTPTTALPDTMDPVSDGRGAIARQKCMEWSKYVNNSTCPTLIAGNGQPTDVPGPLGKIKAGRMEFPHMAAVGFGMDNDTIGWFCGGTLISETFVMTSAVCTFSRDLGDATWVRVGDLNLVRSDDGASPEQRRIVDRIRHPDYKPPAGYNDIALLRLESPVPFNDWIRPACLHTSPTTKTQGAVATGWGRLDWLDDEGAGTDLMKVTLPLVDLEACKATYGIENRIRKLPNGINGDQMICAGAKGRDTCQGDSGGPLVIHSMKERCMYDVVGITSFGRACGGEYPGIYTRVYNYIPWIESIVWKRG